MQKLFPSIQTVLTDQTKLWEDRLKEVCKLVQKNRAYYDWVGFYFADFNTQTLHLKAFVGEPTEHTVIPFGKGICGQVALSNSKLVIPDVGTQENYIPCSIDVRSEIVVPIFVDGKNIGQMDIDSNQLDPFKPEDETFLEAVCEMVTTAYLKKENS